MTRVAIEKVEVGGRTPIYEQAYTACSVANGHVITDGCDGYEIEVINDDTTDDVVVTATRIACPLCDASTEPTEYDPLTPPTAPVIALDEVSGNVTAGTHSVKVSFVTADGESLPSAKSNVVTADGTHQKLTTTVPVSLHAAVTARNVYMSEAGDAGPWKLAGTVADNTTGTLQINVADGSLTTSAPTADTALPLSVGSVTVAAGERGRMGPFPASLYGQGTTGQDLYLTVSGDGADNSAVLAVPCLPFTATPSTPDTSRVVGDEAVIAKVTPPERAGDDDEAPTALDNVNGMVVVGGCDDYYLQIKNDHISDALTVTAGRVACPVCGYGTDPSGMGAVVVAAGDTGYLGPLPASLYGQGATLTDLYLTASHGSGTIVALPA